jgi:hypothetical protein
LRKERKVNGHSIFFLGKVNFSPMCDFNMHS